MTNNGTLNYNLTLEKPAYMLSEENYRKYIDERNKFDPTYPDPNDIRFDAPQYSYSVEETSLYRESSSGELTLIGSVYYPKTGNLIKFENGQAIELKEQVTGNKVPLSSVKKLIPGIEYEFVPILDYSKEYLTFDILTDGTITFKRYYSYSPVVTVQYSKDNGSTWTSITTTTTTTITINVIAGDKLLWKGENTNYGAIGDEDYRNQFGGTAQFNLSGNIMSLMWGDNFVEHSNEFKIPDYPSNDAAFNEMFMGSNVVDASKLILPSTVSGRCYYGMFWGCTNLIKTPKLPAIDLSTVAEGDENDNHGCYQNMFSGCTSLVNAPELPATTLTKYCYGNMFAGCTNLTIAHELPATTLTDYCYSQMFYGCTSLTTAPVLPSTTLANYCYSYMFSGCTSLTTAPILPATTLASSCYYYMFQNCSNLNYIKAMFITTPGTNYTLNWVSGVAATGTFVKNPDALWSVTGVNGIPTGWTVLGGAAR